MRFRDYLRIVRQNGLVLVVLVVLGVAVGFGVSAVQTPKYSATAVTYVSTEQAVNLTDLAQGVTFSQEIVRSYATIVPTPLVLDPAIKALGLNVSAADLAKEVTTVNPLDTVVLNIQVVDPSSTRAASLANAIAASLSSAVTTLTPATSDSVQPVRVTLVERALPPVKPVVPNTLLNVAVGVVAAIALAVFLAVFRDALRRRAEDDAADASTGAPAAVSTGAPADVPPTTPVIATEPPPSIARLPEFRGPEDTGFRLQ